MRPERLKIAIQGAVQGVGFRPFVFRLADEMGLAGWVLNDSRGVFIEVEGERPRLNRFLERLEHEHPPLALIQALETFWLDALGYDGFEIRHSDDRGAKSVVVLPDVATCCDCLRETLDPADRRFGYPFTNCTNCGPRFSIVEALPYDRPNTTMRGFVLCPNCRREYESPRDRRFHAQPNACPICGPQLELWEQLSVERRTQSAERLHPAHRPDGADGRIAGDDSQLKASEIIARAAEALRAGKIVAAKGIGGFHLLADPQNPAAVAQLRTRKRREEKPFALLCRDLEQASLLCELSPAAVALLESPEAPIVLLPRRPDAPVAAGVAPGNPYLGIMLPATPLHHLLMRALDRPLIATSGNLSDEPICTDEHEALTRLGQIADLFLVHNRPIARHVDDSVATFMLGVPRLLRRARGYAPLPVLLAHDLPCILAVGAHLKNTVALSVGRRVFISQHIGDLETPEARAACERVIADFLQLYEALPVAVAHDLHPDYASTHVAREMTGYRLQATENGVRPDGDGSDGDTCTRSERTPHTMARLMAAGCRLLPIQHHHAHLAACMAEHGAVGPTLGVTWDGTGYGLDGTIWGGEFLLGDMAQSRRVAHLRPFRLPGGEMAVREPRRTALALLWELFGPAALELTDLAPLRDLNDGERRLLGQMLEREFNAPVTSSAGRLFDGVAALIGLRQKVAFEGQAAMSLEWVADPAERQHYPFDIRSPGVAAQAAPLLVDWQPTVEAILHDVRRQVAPPTIAGRFHNTLVELIAAIATTVGVPQVALSGGCFQNRLLVERAYQRLSAGGFTVLLHRQVPPGDGGISLGQIAAAAALLAR